MADEQDRTTTRALVAVREPTLSAPTKTRAPAGPRPDRSRGSRPQESAVAKEEPATPPQQRNTPDVGPLDLLAYQRDVLERAILFFDTLRKRANNMLDHERAGLPPLLNFKYETLLDARQFERPVNYALLRITEVGDDCWDDCVDLAKPPVLIIDPRAGHGPGIGGFKRDSEVGIALHTGHPVYFVVFFPEPCKGQTLGDVIKALDRFVAEVAERHDGKRPVLYGNCQGGWAAALVAADCEQQVGAAVLNGSPLSYWAGEPDLNPMRMTGGFVGGVWLNHFLADVNGGRFDGAWLVQNFESLKPGNSYFEKYANLFTKIDTEADRFLDFERWWGGFYRLSREEIVSTVEDLFIGNELEQGQVRLDERCAVDLRKIRNPLVIFASYGDNITPPHQALGWIPAVYRSTEDLKACNQRIVYLTDQKIGHLGIFVSAKVVRFEHRAILENLPEIERLSPGLYEMKIDHPTGDPDCARDQYSVRFEPRNVEDIRFDYPRATFDRVRQVSEFNESVYRTFFSPWVQAMSNPWIALAAQWLHPMRTSRYMFSDSFAPWMTAFSTLADIISNDRQPLSDDHPLITQERQLVAEISSSWETLQRVRDAAEERAFASIYGGRA